MRTPKCSSQWTPTSIYLDIIILVSAQPQPYPGKRWMPYWWLWATTFIDYIVASATEDENLKRTDSAIWLSCENRKMSFFSERWLNATDLFLTRMVNNKIRKIFLPSKHTSTNKCFDIMFFSRFGRSLQFFMSEFELIWIIFLKRMLHGTAQYILCLLLPKSNFYFFFGLGPHTL